MNNVDLGAEGLRSFYKGRKVFLTGHTGFKGAWMLALLERLECDVIGYALEAEEQSLYQILGLDSGIKSIINDIRDRDFLKKSIVENEPDIIFHFAAQPLVLSSYEDPAYTFEVNAMGTLNILEAVKNYDNTCEVVIITTDKVYKNKEWLYGYREVDELGGRDPYSASKSVAELIVSSYIESFFSNGNKKIATARAGNVIGGGDHSKDRIIPDIIRSFMEGSPVELRNPKAVRPWQHVLDPLYGYLTLGYALNQSSETSICYNFGPLVAENLSVEKLVSRVLELWGEGDYTLRDAVQHESRMLELDSTKATVELKWKPTFNTEEAIAYTVDWYKKVLVEKKDPLKVTRDQIVDFFERN